MASHRKASLFDATPGAWPGRLKRAPLKSSPAVWTEMTTAPSKKGPAQSTQLKLQPWTASAVCLVTKERKLMNLRALALAVVASTLATGCVSFSSTSRTVPAPAPAPAATTVVVPAQSTQTTNYNDSVTGKPLSSEKVVTTRY